MCKVLAGWDSPGMGLAPDLAHEPGKMNVSGGCSVHVNPQRERMFELRARAAFSLINVQFTLIGVI